MATAPDPEALVLGPDDVPEMLDLVERTRPGPFRPATITIGTYLGFRDTAGALIAMAGERMRPPGWTEISAVCTDPAHRGRGLATRLVRAVGAAIRDRGDVPFLHTTRDNTAAIRASTRRWASCTAAPSSSPPTRCPRSARDYMLRRYWPPTSKNASVIWPSEHTRAASISSSNTLPSPVADVLQPAQRGRRRRGVPGLEVGEPVELALLLRLGRPGQLDLLRRVVGLGPDGTC